MGAVGLGKKQGWPMSEVASVSGLTHVDAATTPPTRRSLGLGARVAGAWPDAPFRPTCGLVLPKACSQR